MPAPKGTRPPNAGKGRKAGVPNKATATARNVFAAFVEGNVGKVQGLWDKVAKKDPARALEIYGKLAEFCMPKLARTETTLDGEVTVATRLIIKQPHA